MEGNELDDDSSASVASIDTSVVNAQNSFANHVTSLQTRGISVQLSPLATQLQLVNTKRAALHSSQSLNSNNEKMNVRKRPIDERTADGSSLPTLTASALKNNRFAILSDLDLSSNKLPKVEKTQQQTNFSNKFCPPIVLYNVKIKNLIDKFKSLDQKFEFKFKNISADKSKLFVKDEAIHSDIMAMLKDKKIPSYSFTLESLRQSKAILRGLHSYMSESDIFNELSTMLPNYIDSVKKLITPHSKKMDRDTGLFVVTLLPGKPLTDLIKIKIIEYQSVTWEKPKSSGGIVQCKKCQSWGHMAKNCNKLYVCVKCDKPHGPGECVLPRDDKTKPFCANCRSWGHPANFRGCPEYQKFADLKSKIKAKLSSPIPPNYRNNVVSNGMSYANALKKNVKSRVESGSAGSTLIDKFLEIANTILMPEPISLEDRIQNFLHSYQSMTVEVRRRECLSLMEDINSQYDSK